MLQADVLPNMGFSSTRKRLVRSHECVPSVAHDDSEEEKDEYAAAGNDESSNGQEENASLRNDAGNTSAGIQDELWGEQSMSGNRALSFELLLVRQRRRGSFGVRMAAII